jgi:hypothetical protein
MNRSPLPPFCRLDAPPRNAPPFEPDTQLAQLQKKSGEVPQRQQHEWKSRPTPN